MTYGRIMTIKAALTVPVRGRIIRDPAMHRRRIPEWLGHAPARGGFAMLAGAEAIA
ncbi:MAG: hypothetical protein ACI9IV_001401 [Paracoccaceae bacterium]|jgi:hypothetical protein